MIPTNSNSTNNCDPISSNCVVWQGADLPCVNICQGDTISDVVAALCTELTLLQTLVGNGGTDFNIANINQSELTGNQATNLEELIQLMIDNIILNHGSGSSSGSTSTFDCSEVMKCVPTVPGCFTEITGYQTGNTLATWINVVSQEICDLNQGSSTQQAITSSLDQRLITLEQAPQGQPNPRMYSSGVTAKNVITPIETIVQALDSQFVSLRNTTGTSSNITEGINTQPADLATPVSSEGYSKALKTSPTTQGDTTYNSWLAIEDLRKAVKDIQDNCCANIQVQRMGGINSFYANSTECALALTAAGTSTNCFDIWNTTGVQFDTTVRAYTSPYNVSQATELVHNRYYALCAGGPIARYSRTAPFWNSIVSSCEG